MNLDLPHHFGWLVVRVLAIVLTPFLQFLLQDTDVYWPYLVSAFAIALGAYCLANGRSRSSVIAFRRRFLSRRIWAHPSATADYSYYLVNAITWPIVFAPLVVTGGAIAAAVDEALGIAFGSPTHSAVPLVLLRAIYTVLFFLAYDFGRFVAHDLLHDVPVLWQFHKLHHSAEVLTPFTSYRMHPVELLIMAVVPNLATGILSGLFWYCAGNEIGFYSFLGVHVFTAIFNAFSNLRHFPVWISFGPVLDRWLISPAHHQLHHSSAARHAGVNRGFALAVWDRMRGTLLVPGAEEELTFGLGDGTDGAWHGVARMYGWPVRYALARVGLASAPIAATPAVNALPEPP